MTTRASSGDFKLEDPTCPKCEGHGHLGPFNEPPSEVICSLCDGRGVVKLSVATDWILQQGRALDTPPPERPQ